MHSPQKRFSSNPPLKAPQFEPSPIKVNPKNQKGSQKASSLIAHGDQGIKKIHNKQAKYEQNTLKGLEMNMESDNDELQNYLDLMKSGPIDKIKKSTNLQAHQKKENYLTPPPLLNPNLTQDITVNDATKSIKGQSSFQNEPHPAFENSMAQTQVYNKSEANSFVLNPNQNDMSSNFKKQVQPLKSSFYQNNCRNLQKESLNHQKNKMFCENLQCSISDLHHQQNSIQNSKDQPHFNISSYHANTQPQIRNQIKNHRAQNNPQSDRKKLDKVPDKRLTLRDYLYIAQLSENRQKSTTALGSQFKSASRQNSRKKKSQVSKGEVLSRIKEQISQSIKTIQNNLHEALNFIENSRQITNQQEQIMKMYNLCRIIKDQMVGQSEQVAKFITDSNIQ